MNTLSLNGMWNLSGGEIACTAKIPGDFHTALIENGYLKNPIYGLNEQDQLWVGRTDWTIKRDFEFKKRSDKNYRYILEFTEADTIFIFKINGKTAGKGQNEFIRYRFDITDFLNDGKNTIEFLFKSPEKTAAEINESLSYPVPCSVYPVDSPHRNLIRKCQCNGGWDWGPCVMVSGIYGGINIIETEKGLFDWVKVNYEAPEKDSKEWIANIDFNFNSFQQINTDFLVAVYDEDEKIAATPLSVTLSTGNNQFSASVKVNNPSVWMTSGELKEAGLKENKLYKLIISTTDEDSELSISKTICFNTLKLVSEKDIVQGKPGRSLYFENNGRKLFAKGADWIPVDYLPSGFTKDKYDSLLHSAIDANMNIIRVWGGGIYEKEYFYELCDRLGIIIWHDFMFACSTYSIYEEFLQEVEKEVEYQILRLQSHACIGIWCGNNENYGALNWFKESRENRDRYLVDYDRLFTGIIAKKVHQLDKNRVFWPSSPCSGPDDFADNWHCDSMGDMHYWTVWHEKKNFSAYLDISPRFVSEFGYESFPSLESIDTYCPQNQKNLTSKVMEYHQRSAGGNSIILENFSRYFSFPKGFENMVYLSQVQQAMAIKTAVDYWRSLKPHCMGSIVWQLNDVWPCASWSSIEYNGKWKLLQYEEKKFYENVYLPVYIKDDKVRAFICNDTNEKLKAEVQINFIKFDGSEYKASIIKKVTVECDETLMCYEADIDTENSESYFIYAVLNAESETGKVYKSENSLVQTVYKYCQLEKANITAEFVQSNTDNTIEITVSTDKPAFFVTLDWCNPSIKGRFSTNNETILPGEPKKIFFYSENKLSVEEFKQAVTIYDLSSSY